ncbi:PaaX family transcriptional regulator [Pseudonocardiaceae bacterium YIM PH 21723]|nr:PaaX family transcriptional regulator [Pseudonocardiaceae bacterium YIM PH 21723]
MGAFGDRSGRTLVWSGGLVALLTEFGFSEGAARVALSRVVRRELLEPVRSGRMISYRITPRLAQLLAEGDERIFQLGRRVPAGTEWTVLWHAIPDDRRTARERLVRRLRFLGFGQLQDGAWLAARNREHQVSTVLEELDVAKFAGLMLGRPSQILDAGALISRAWDLAGLDVRYRAFVTEFSAARLAEQDDAGALNLRTRLVHTYREFPFLDPELPTDIAPAPAARADAVRLFHELYQLLALPAQRHFDRVTSLGGELS